MSITHETEAELNAMLDEGVRVEVAEQGGDVYQVLVVVEDAACADCLVPDATLASIAADALQRRGARVSSVRVEHQGVEDQGVEDQAVEDKGVEDQAVEHGDAEHGTGADAVGGVTGTLLPEAEQSLGSSAPVPPPGPA